MTTNNESLPTSAQKTTSSFTVLRPEEDNRNINQVCTPVWWPLRANRFRLMSAALSQPVTLHDGLGCRGAANKGIKDICFHVLRPERNAQCADRKGRWAGSVRTLMKWVFESTASVARERSGWPKGALKLSSLIGAIRSNSSESRWWIFYSVPQAHNHPCFNSRSTRIARKWGNVCCHIDYVNSDSKKMKNM